MDEVYFAKGTKLGLTGEALAKYVTELVRRWEELALQKGAKEAESALKQRDIEGQEESRRRQDELRQREVEETVRLQEERVQIERMDFDARQAHRKDKEGKVEWGYLQSLLSPFNDGDDLDQYLAHFERVARLAKWDEGSWAQRVIELLRGRARDACLRLSDAVTNSYHDLKAHLLDYFHLDL